MHSCLTQIAKNVNIYRSARSIILAHFDETMTLVETQIVKYSTLLAWGHAFDVIYAMKLIET